MNGRSLRRQGGQTLIIAIIILGVLLIIGFAFAGIISRNIIEAGRNQVRNASAELSQSGINLAHYQLVNSPEGADYRPARTFPSDYDATLPLATVQLSRDPDALYLRPGSGLVVTPNPANPAETTVDMGGPDFKGPYSREFTSKGRRLVRIRQVANDYEGIARQSDGTMREAGKAKSYIIIESVGRVGSLTSRGKADPSSSLPKAVQVSGFASGAQVVQAVGEAKGLDTTVNIDSKKMIAFASIGLIEHGLFVTDKFSKRETAQIGLPIQPAGSSALDAAGWGVTYAGQPVEVQSVLGRSFTEPTPGRSNNWRTIPGGGSIYINSPVEFYGQNRINLNVTLGESLMVAGSIKPANSEARLFITRTFYDRAADLWRSTFNATNTNTTPIVVTGQNPRPGGTFPMDSTDSQFDTVGGTLRDRESLTDSTGNPRAAARKEPPSMLTVDPANGANRYYTLTRNSGRMINGRQIGRFGYGSGIYIDSAERANLDTEDERREQGAVRSLPADWLNPNNPNSVGWQGPYYIPVATSINLLPDGFEITRDSRSNRRFWRNANGAPTNTSTCKYRIRQVEFPVGSGNFVPFIINSIMFPNLVNAANGTLTDNDFRNNGEPFNGVIYSEGDVRVRGVIATDVQITIAAMGTVYVDGSITKGLINVTNTDPSAYGTVLARPSRSMLMLMARDFITVNTTQFFGPATGQSPATKTTDITADTPNPVELDASDSPELTFTSEFLLGADAGPGGNVLNPQTWSPYGTQYTAYASGSPLLPDFLMSVSADDNGPTYASLDIMPLSFVDPGASVWRTYPFPRTVDFGTGAFVFNAADPYFAPAATIPVYGLGDPTINAYPKFETMPFPSIFPSATSTQRRITGYAGPNSYELALQDPTLFKLRLSAVGQTAPKNMLVARTAIQPHDIRIEASMFAEEGSFFVIPGNWFNTNSDDTRERFNNDVASFGGPQANLRRFQSFGSGPSVPFYGEPLDVRVQIFGALSENMPAPMSQQLEWKKKWGWIPNRFGSTGEYIPSQHVPNGYVINGPNTAVPNFTFSYDPALAFASADGVNPIRRSPEGWVLPPLPRLPVSPVLSYFGESNP